MGGAFLNPAPGEFAAGYWSKGIAEFSDAAAAAFGEAAEAWIDRRMSLGRMVRRRERRPA